MDLTREDTNPERDTAACSQHVMEFFAGFLKVVRFLKLYPAAHPFIEQSVHDLRERWKEAREIRREMGLEARTGSITLDGVELFHAPKALEPLKKILEDKTIERITINQHTEFDELKALAELLAKTRDEVFEREGVKPVHFFNLRGVNIVRHGAPQAAPEAGAPSLAPTHPPVLAELSRLLTNALPSSPAQTHDVAQDSVLALTQLLLQSGHQAQPLELPDDPTLLAHGILVAVNRLLLGQDEPNDGELQAAFAHCLERIVLGELDQRSGGCDSVEAMVVNAMRPFDEGFTRKILPQDENGGRDVDQLFRKFSDQIKLRVLKHELRQKEMSRHRFRTVLERFTQTDAERQDLVTSLRTAIADDTDSKDEYQRAAEILGERSQTTTGVRRIILALEPLPDECRTLRQAFEAESVDLHVMMESDAFLEAYERLQPDLVIIEPKLRELHGLQIISKLRRNARDGTPVPLCVFTEEQSFRHDFEIATYPDHQFVLKTEGAERLAQVALNVLAGERTPSRQKVIDYETFRPNPTVANQHFFVPRFEILTYHHADDDGLPAFFDVVPIDETKTALLISGGFRTAEDDGKAVRKLRQTIHRLLQRAESPREVLRALNDALHEGFCNPPLVPTQAMLLDARTGTVSCCWAGGPRPIRLGPTGEAEELTIPSGIVLGFSQTHVFEASLKERVYPIPAGYTMFSHCHGLAAAVGGGEEARAFRELRRNAALAFHEAKTPAKALVIAHNRLKAAIEEEQAFPGDKAGIWIRALERTAAPIITTAPATEVRERR